MLVSWRVVFLRAYQKLWFTVGKWFIPFLMKGSLSTFIIQRYRCNSVLAGPNGPMFIYDILFKVCFARVGRTKPKCQRASFPHLSIIPLTLFYGMVTMKGAGDEGRS